MDADCCPMAQVRDKAVLVLSKWFRAQRSFEEDDHIKVWKALFYCMWMSDKRLVQEELADKIADFIHVFPTLEQAKLFLKTFYSTMHREWPVIDRLRLDKFYNLMRSMQREMFVLLAENKWNQGLVRDFNSIMSAGPLHVGCARRTTLAQRPLQGRPLPPLPSRVKLTSLYANSNA